METVPPAFPNEECKQSQQEDTRTHLHRPARGAWGSRPQRGGNVKVGKVVELTGVSFNNKLAAARPVAEGKQTDEARPVRQTETREAAEH